MNYMERTSVKDSVGREEDNMAMTGFGLLKQDYRTCSEEIKKEHQKCSA